MQKLSTEVQYLISASYYINTFSAAITELVYNSLDANSTSIAIRLNIHDSNIQVVDNGFGIIRSDFDLLGQRFATSKFVNTSDLKLAPYTYGFRGLALASIIEVCSVVIITSRYQSDQETSSKLFFKGESKGISKATHRPSRGTTVDIKGFLYNLKLQRKAIENNNEFQAIKGLLKQLSLVHVNVSFSLRDDGKNEILFQINKNRDLNITLSNLFDISSEDYQELQIEKRDYKVKAFIGKRDVDSRNYQWIYLNNKFIPKTKMHTIMNTNLIKYLGIQRKKITKRVNLHDKEIGNQDIPFYFLFISCPRLDYDINYNVKSIRIEFKNWDQIKNQLEKLVQCYSGDIKLKEISKQKYQNNVQANLNTKEEVKKIMEKILVNNTKKQKTLQMHHGAKGKHIKRKKANIKKQAQKNELKNNAKLTPALQDKSQNLHSQLTQKKSRKLINYEMQSKNCKPKSQKSKQKMPINRTSFMYKFNNPSESSKRKHKILQQPTEKNIPRPRSYLPSESECLKKPTKSDVPTLMVEELKEKKSDPYQENHNLDQVNLKYEKFSVLSTYDLVQSVLYYVSDNNINNNYQNNYEIEPDSPERFYHNNNNTNNNEPVYSSKLTYESHNYSRTKHYISNASRKNFQVQRTPYQNSSKKHKKPHQINKTTILRSLKLGANESLYTIDVSSSINNFQYKNNDQNNKRNISDDMNKTLSNIFEDNIKTVIGTYSIDPDLILYNQDANINLALDVTYSIHLTRHNVLHSDNTCNEENQCKENTIINSDDINAIYSHIGNPGSLDLIDKGSIHSQIIENDVGEIEPIGICETVLTNTSDGTNKQIETYANSNKKDSLFSGSMNENKNYNYCSDIVNINGLAPNITSHHFHSLLTEEINDIFMDTFHADSKPNAIIFNDNQCLEENNENAFVIEGRCNFMPKGMSPITKNYYTKELNPTEDDYYDDTIYKNFAEAVLETAQIFEQNVQSVNDLITHDTNKANNKMKKDCADLIFNSESIRVGKVLGQVDNKFIATILPGKTASSEQCSHFLVLFDQHAVHERIRLENNLADYFDGATWVTENIDAISFKVAQDDAIFLHNYKDRLNIFGLQWTINENVISIYGIPKAILGKANRQVDVIIKAVKSLISELIGSLKLLKGNIPLYPQTIMNLVFSEACRYAIMFGDQLSKANCEELLQSLSECKTPFQCAHGRPVMAVIMEIDGNKHKYKMDYERVKRFVQTKSAKII